MLETFIALGLVTQPIDTSTAIQTLTEQSIVQQIEPITHTVQENETLTKIAKLHSIEVDRLWAKNTQLINQDQLEIGQILTIPSADEVLEPRAYVVPVYVQSPVLRERGESSGNLYQAGQCVWYVKNLRPELPNTWRSARNWLANARADGWATGSTPQVNAVGIRGNHAVLITGINEDGTVNYTDMNGRWVAFEIGYGTKPANYYQYIY